MDANASRRLQLSSALAFSCQLVTTAYCGACCARSNVVKHALRMHEGTTLGFLERWEDKYRVWFPLSGLVFSALTYPPYALENRTGKEEYDIDSELAWLIDQLPRLEEADDRVKANQQRERRTILAPSPTRDRITPTAPSPSRPNHST